MQLTIPIEDAVEAQRQQVDEATGTVRLVVELTQLNPGLKRELEAINPDVLWPIIEEFKSKCRHLGALDQFCASNGVTDRVMTRKLGGQV